MKQKKSISVFNAVLLIMLVALNVACEPFAEQGYRIDYGPSNAEFKVEPIAYEMAAANEIISYEIIAKSDVAIKSIIVQSTNNGANGSGFDVSDEAYDDPFADHNYGTMKKDINKFRVKYNFVVPSDISKSRITFSLIDDEGKIAVQRNIQVVPALAKFNSKKLYAKNNINFDAISFIDGSVYQDIKTNYSTFSEVNKSVQEKIDMLFFYDSNRRTTVIASPKSEQNGLNLFVENNTKFKKISLSNEQFDNLNSASLIEVTTGDSIQQKGTSQISGVKVGDIIGFTTDLSSTESLKTGVLRITALHPINVTHYEGTAYTMEFDAVVQKKL